MAFYSDSSAAAAAPFASNFEASPNLFMNNADPDYFINPLEDDALDNSNNISLSCNAAMNESCVWQPFVEGHAEAVAAIPSEYESRVRCDKPEAVAAFAYESKQCFKRSKSNKFNFTPSQFPSTPTPPPTKSCFIPYSYDRGYCSMSSSMSGSIISGSSHLLDGGQHLLQLN